MKNDVRVTPSRTTPLGRFKLWSGIVAVLLWTLGLLWLAGYLIGSLMEHFQGDATSHSLGTLWRVGHGALILGQGALLIACGEALRHHRREFAYLEPADLESVHAVLQTETRIWQFVVALVAFTVGLVVVMDVTRAISRVLSSWAIGGM